MSRFPAAAAALLVAVVAACQPAPMSDAQRAAVADEVTAAMDTAMAGLNQLDEAPWVALLQGNEAYVENTTLYPSRDSLMVAVHAFPDMARSLNLTWDGEPTVTVLGPDAAALTGKFVQAMVDTSGTAMTFHGVWSGVLRRVDGAWTIVQAHETYALVES